MPENIDLVRWRITAANHLAAGNPPYKCRPIPDELAAFILDGSGEDDRWTSSFRCEEDRWDMLRAVYESVVRVHAGYVEDEVDVRSVEFRSVYDVYVGEGPPPELTSRGFNADLFLDARAVTDYVWTQARQRRREHYQKFIKESPGYSGYVGFLISRFQPGRNWY
jgi:hypothetical protein